MTMMLESDKRFAPKSCRIWTSFSCISGHESGNADCIHCLMSASTIAKSDQSVSSPPSVGKDFLVMNSLASPFANLTV